LHLITRALGLCKSRRRVIGNSAIGEDNRVTGAHLSTPRRAPLTARKSAYFQHPRETARTNVHCSLGLDSIVAVGEQTDETTISYLRSIHPSNRQTEGAHLAGTVVKLDQIAARGGCAIWRENPLRIVLAAGLTITKTACLSCCRLLCIGPILRIF